MLHRLLFAGALACGWLGALPIASAWQRHLSFEKGVAGRRANGPTGFGRNGAFSGTRFSRRVAHSGNQSAELSIERGMKGFGHWGATVRFAEPLYQDDELWLLFHVLFPEDFDMRSEGGRLPLVRFHMVSAGGRPEASLELALKGGGKHLELLRQQGQGKLERVSQQEMSRFKPLERGKWHAIEVHLRLASKGHNGLVRVWHNAALVLESRHIRLLENSFSRVEHLFFFGAWPGGSPRTQVAYLDDVVLTTDRPAQRDRRGNARLWPFASRSDGTD